MQKFLSRVKDYTLWFYLQKYQYYYLKDLKNFIPDNIKEVDLQRENSCM